MFPILHLTSAYMCSTMHMKNIASILTGLSLGLSIVLGMKLNDSKMFSF